MSPEDAEDLAMSESALKAAVLRLAKVHGWKVQHLSHEPRHAYRLGGRGFPDLVLARGGIIWFVELKRQDKDLDPEQVAWFEALAIFAMVWRPSDLRLGTVHRVLA